MNASEFNKVFEQTVEMCRQTLCHKADEYADKQIANEQYTELLRACMNDGSVTYQMPEDKG